VDREYMQLNTDYEPCGSSIFRTCTTGSLHCRGEKGKAFEEPVLNLAGLEAEIFRK
jgi:hypothetical protein